MAVVEKKRSLLESDDEGEEDLEPTLKVNEEFARRLEHNKKREDLHRLQELQKRGLVQDSDDSEEDDEDEDEDGLLPQRTEVRIFDTLNRIRNKDPRIYKPDIKFFDEEEEEAEEDEDDDESQRKKKAVFLKDVVARQALDGNPADDDDEDPKKRGFKTYAEEQQELKDEFLKGVAAGDGDDNEEETLFKMRKKSEAEPEEAEEKDEEITRKLDEYFGEDKELNENDKFLKNYLLNQGWIDKEKDKRPTYEDIVGEVSEEEDHLEEQDEYEAKYNFRFEEGAGSQVLGHARVVEDSVRKLPEKEKRKERRKKKEARLLEMEVAKQEEVKRLKNVKKKEILEKMAKIQTIAGMASLENFSEGDLQEDFDPAEYDKKMQEVFGEEYYNQNDPDENFHSGDEGELEKPDFDAEDEELEKQGFAAVREKQKEMNSDEAEVLKEEIEQKLEEYYKLDYEDIVGGMPTRFKYTRVNPNRFGLSTAQILDSEDAELNQHVSLKALAPYRTDEWIPRHKYHRITKKERKRRALDQVPSLKSNDKEQKPESSNKEQKPEGKRNKSKEQKREQEPTPLRHPDAGASSDQKLGEPETAGGDNEPGKKKRKRKKQGLNMSQNRLLSYGKIDLPKKKKRKY